MHLIVGRIVRPHGIRGEVIVEVRTDEPQSRFRVGAALLTGTDAGPGPLSAAGTPPGADDIEGDAGVRWEVPPALTIDEARTHLGRLIVAFAEVDDRNLAEAVRGVVLWVDAASLAPPADPDEFHDHQLVGLRAVTPAGEPLGEVTRVDHAPAADLLVLRRPTGGQALVPFVREIVPEVDLAGGRVVVDPPAGLFDL